MSDSDDTVERVAELGVGLGSAALGSVVATLAGGGILGALAGAALVFGFKNADNMLENDRIVDPAHPYTYM